MMLHVLTAITRPQTLAQIAQSLAPALAAGVDLIWHWRADLDMQHVGGQALKNAMLDQIEDGWCWILDDDNSANPDLFPALAETIARHPDARLIVIAQRHRNGWVRRVGRSMLRATHVDAGQVIIRRDAIGDIRIPLHYCGDGEWIEAIADALPDEQIISIGQPLVYYNWLREP